MPSQHNEVHTVVVVDVIKVISLDYSEVFCECEGMRTITGIIVHEVFVGDQPQAPDSLTEPCLMVNVTLVVTCHNPSQNPKNYKMNSLHFAFKAASQANGKLKASTIYGFH